jgi:hypothetical protein
MSEHDERVLAFYRHSAEVASDPQLIEDLLNALFCLQHIEQTDPATLEAGIVELFCEAMRRGLEIPELVPEPMVPATALRLALRAIGSRDRDGLWRALPHLNGAGLWQVFCRRRELPSAEHPFVWLEAIAFLVEWLLFTPETAIARREARREADLPPDDYGALLELTIASLFGRYQMSLDRIEWR